MTSSFARLSFCLLGGLLPLSASANLFQQHLQQLEVENPVFMFHMGMDGDFNRLGDLLTRIYQGRLAVDPALPPFAVNFNAVFRNIGIAQLNGISVVSQQRDNAPGFRNQTLISFSQPPKGLFLLGGDANQPFDFGSSIPADADIYFEGAIHLNSLVPIAIQTASDFMGPFGADLVRSQLNGQILEDGTTVQQLLNRLSTRISGAMRFNDPQFRNANTFLKKNDLVLKIEGIATLLPAVANFLNAIQPMGFQLVRHDEESTWVLRNPGKPDEIAIFFIADAASGDVVLVFSPDSMAWLGNNADSLAGSAALQPFKSALPNDGTVFWFVSERFSRLQFSLLKPEEISDPITASLWNVLMPFLDPFAGAQAGVSYFDGNAIRSEALQPASFKGSVAISALVPLLALSPTLGQPQPADDADAAESDSDTQPKP